MNRLSRDRQVAVVKALAKGASIRATVRLTAAAKDTVTNLLVAVGTACAEYQRQTLRNLNSSLVQCDEIWAFVGAKEKNVAPHLRGQGRGDAWTWTAMDAESKLMFAWHVGRRDADAARSFMAANAFSKKIENHAHAVALHFMYYNFCKSHGTLTKNANGIHTTPAMAAGVADHVWKVEEIIELL